MEPSEKHLPEPSSIRFQVWGARGSRNTVGSQIGNHTSCYSLTMGKHLFVFDAGSGLLPLSASLLQDQSEVEHVHLLISHAHWDHWEGIKDAEWFWRKQNGIQLTILGPQEALDTMQQCIRPPAFVELKILALGSLKSLSFQELDAGRSVQLPGAQLDPISLNHYSGIAPNRNYLSTLGYRLRILGGPTLVYMCDHEPTADTSEMEGSALADADLAILDASYGSVSEHAFGHGSIESAATLSRRFPELRVLAAHHGPTSSDEGIHEAAALHGAGLSEFSVANEGMVLDWHSESGRFR